MCFTSRTLLILECDVLRLLVTYDIHILCLNRNANCEYFPVHIYWISSNRSIIKYVQLYSNTQLRNISILNLQFTGVLYVCMYECVCMLKFWPWYCCYGPVRPCTWSHVAGRGPFISVIGAGCPRCAIHHRPLPLAHIHTYVYIHIPCSKAPGTHTHSSVVCDILF